MRWSYTDCDVEITTAFDPDNMFITPIVEIDCQDTFGRAITISTSRAFRTSELAEKCGIEMAREWIEKNLEKRPWVGLITPAT